MKTPAPQPDPFPRRPDPDALWRARARWSIIGAMALLPLFSSIFFLIGLTLALDVPGPGESASPRWLLYPLLGYPGIGLAGVVGGLLLYRAQGFLFAIACALAPLGVVVFGLVALVHWWLS